MPKFRQVVITGAGVATPVGNELPMLFDAVWQGRGQFSEIIHKRAADTPVRYMGACANPDAKKLPDRKVQKILRRKDVISLLTILETARHARADKGALNPERTGMYVGASSTQIADLEPYYELVANSLEPSGRSYDAAKFGANLMGTVNPLVVLQTLMNNSLCFGAMTLDIRGVNANFMDFQAAGLRAVGEGWLSIATGRADHVLAGGVSTSVEPFQMQEGVASGYIAKTREMTTDPQRVVRPYDAARVGTILSEGSAYVLLEEESAARARGATILGRLSGFGLAADGAVNIMGAHSATGLGRAATAALRHTSLSPKDLGVVIGHGSGSVHGDKAEAEAFANLLGAASSVVPVSSPKAVLGDMCEAGGVVGLIIALESLRRREAPPTLNYEAGDEFSKRLGLQARPQPVANASALVTARSFLGLSAAVIVTAA